MSTRVRICAVVALLSFLAFMPASGSVYAAARKRSAKSVVYVCACLETKSCSCMTEAKMEGPCACGTKGGPPLKAVPSDSAWAKANRDALAQ